MSRHPLLEEAQHHIDRATGGIHTLHLGPLDYNISTTTDDLMVAIRLIEEYGSQASTLVPHDGSTTSVVKDSLTTADTTQEKT